MIHKRDWETRINGQVTWSRCAPTAVWSTPQYDSPEYVEWERVNKFRWQYVTCEECLRTRRMRNENGNRV